MQVEAYVIQDWLESRIWFGLIFFNCISGDSVCYSSCIEIPDCDGTDMVGWRCKFHWAIFLSVVFMSVIMLTVSFLMCIYMERGKCTDALLYPNSFQRYSKRRSSTVSSGSIRNYRKFSSPRYSLSNGSTNGRQPISNLPTQYLWIFWHYLLNLNTNIIFLLIV